MREPTGQSRPFRRWLAVFAAGVVLCVAGGLLYARPRPPQVHLFTVEPVTLQDRVFASGTVRPLSRQVVPATALSAPVARLYVHPGDKVRPGEVLASLQNQSQKAALYSAKVAVRSAQAVFATALAQYEQAPLGLKPQFRSTLESARTQLAQARAQLAQAQAAYQASYIRAQFAGVVLVADADGLAPDGSAAPVLEVVSPQKRVVVNVGEADAVHIRPGMRATIRSDAYPQAQWPAMVTWVDLYASTDNGNTGGQVGVELTPRSAFPVPYGYQVDVEILAATRAHVLAVPYDALVQSSGGYAVYVYRNGRVHRSEVALGMTTDNRVEVTRGLKAGDRVVLNPPDQLRDGEVVRPA